MKLLKSILSILLVFSFIFAFASCGDGKTDETETTTKQEEVTTEGVKTDPISLTINGVDISEYTIVYGVSEYAKVGTIKNDMEGETDKNYACAEYLISVLKKNTGKTLKSIPEATYKAKTSEYDHVIYMGKTSYNTAYVPAKNNFSTFWSATAYATHSVCADMDNYTIALDDNYNISICGGTFGTTYHAIDSIDNWLKEKVAKGENAIWDSSVNLSGSYHIKVVACIGDSITAGAQASNSLYFSYVANLNRMLWTDYYFINYGVSGKTMRSDLADAYQSCSAYPKVMDDTIDYDIVTIMLGTNDSNRDATPWEESEVENFKDEMYSFIYELYQDNGSDTIFIVMNCPAYYGTSRFGDKYVRDLQLETAKEIYEMGAFKLYFFDMNTFSNEVLTSANFPDQLHPGDEGYALMAEGIGEMIEAVVNKTSNKYLVDLK